MTFADTAITMSVLIAVFFLLYTNFRKQGIGDTIKEIKEAFSEKVEDVKQTGGAYINK